MARDILIIGGTGVFGKRLVRHLSANGDVVLHVASRSLAKAEMFTKTLQGAKARLIPVALDSRVNLQEALDQIAPFIVVDCSGPFQGAGYDIARHVLAAGAHFIDLADARDYLSGFVRALDDSARRRGISALAGASSTPTLSTCIAQHLTEGWQSVDTIDIAITPGGKSEVGRSVIQAILSYAGMDVPVWKDGRLTHITGWQNGKRITVPGLGHRRVAAVETFDAEYLGPKLGVQTRVSFSAGLESWIEQFGIETIAALRKRGLMSDPTALISLLLAARRITRMPTSANGGMLVEISGVNADGVQTRTQWALVARQDHGPTIPILPAAAAIRKLMTGAVSPGAGFAHAALTLSDILDEMRGYDIKTAVSSCRVDEGQAEQLHQMA